MWLIIGLVVGAALLWLELTVRNKGWAVTWYDRLIGALGLVLLMFTVQNFFGSLAELEPTAANLFLLVTGLPALILLAVSWQLIARRQRV